MSLKRKKYGNKKKYEHDSSIKWLFFKFQFNYNIMLKMSSILFGGSIKT